MNFKLTYSLSLILSLFFVITSCGRKKGKFTQDELAWLVYNEGDTITYVDQQNKTHELMVEYRTDHLQVKSYYPIEAEIEIVDPKSDDHFRIYLLKDENQFKKYIRIAEVYRPLDLMKTYDYMEINGRLYHDVYLVEEDSSKINTDVYRVFYNKAYGILKYEKKGDIVCELAASSDS